MRFQEYYFGLGYQMTKEAMEKTAEDTPSEKGIVPNALKGAGLGALLGTVGVGGIGALGSYLSAKGYDVPGFDDGGISTKEFLELAGETPLSYTLKNGMLNAGAGALAGTGIGTLLGAGYGYKESK